MSKVKSYQDEKTIPYVAAVGKYVHGTKVRELETLHVTHISGTFENAATTEYIEIGYWNGHAYIPVHKDKPAVTSDPVHWNGDIWLREQQYVYVYCADVAVGEIIRLKAEGRWE